MTRMAETWIRLLGPPAIESPGATPLQPRGRKAWAVLAYLALQPDGTGRSRTAVAAVSRMPRIRSAPCAGTCPSCGGPSTA